MRSFDRIWRFRGVSMVVAVLALALVLGACGLQGPAYAERTSPGVDAYVDMTNLLNYSPSSLTIQAGDTVEWRNTAQVTHTVTAVPGAAENPANVILPEGAEPFDSGNVKPGQIYRHTFTVPGVYRYFCRPHEDQGMVGTIVVEG